MAKIQLGTGSSSASSHRMTQSSRTLNRRYVDRPSNLILEEAAEAAKYDHQPAASTPSRLVNLRVHAADLQQIQQSAPQEPVFTPAEPRQVVPKVVELGSIDREMVADNIGMNLNQIVPPEDNIEEQPIYEQTSSVAMPAADTSVSYNANEMALVPSAANIDPQTLAMDIAADYAAASFGASVNEAAMNNATINDAVTPYNAGVGMVATSDNSIDVIAQAASEAIAAIRVATDPAEVAEQITSLRAFAENIKSTAATPEMLELSDTIEKFVDIAMKSTKVQEEVDKRTSKKSEPVKPTISRTTPATKSAPRLAASAPKAAPRAINTTRSARTATPKVRPMARRTTRATAPKLVADEDQALRKALRSVAAMDDETTPAAKISRRAPARAKTGRKRFALAFICATACVAAVVYFVGTNIPDISVKVAAMQTGIEAKYPSYVPRDFSLSDISSENGKITLTFKGPDQASFTLSEEKSSWDSTALLRNYVEPTWQNNYTTTHEQGITVYIAGANAAWVNGGVLYKINTPGGSSLTNKQLRNIVTSL